MHNYILSHEICTGLIEIFFDQAQFFLNAYLDIIYVKILRLCIIMCMILDKPKNCWKTASIIVTYCKLCKMMTLSKIRQIIVENHNSYTQYA